MSESSSELGAAGRRRSVDELVERLRAKTLAERLPLLAHLSIGRTLCKLRDAITDGDPVSAKAGKTLLCADTVDLAAYLNWTGYNRRVGDTVPLPDDSESPSEDLHVAPGDAPLVSARLLVLLCGEGRRVPREARLQRIVRVLLRGR